MNHLDFIVWMFGFPIMCAIEEAIRNKWCEPKKYSDNINGWSALMMMALYLLIGAALFN